MTKREINFNPILLKKLIYIMLLIDLILSIAIFFSLNIDLAYEYFISMLLVFFSLLVVFYLNRLELDKIIFNNKVTIRYVNKFFFKRKPHELKKENLKVYEVNDSKLKIIINYKVIGFLRKKSLSKNDWDFLKDKLSSFM